MENSDTSESAKYIFTEERPSDWRVSALAFLLALVIHGLIFFAVPSSFLSAAPHINIEELELEILPPELDEPVPVIPEYVEANPNANMDSPDKDTNQHSFQDQHTAQENPDPESDSPLPEMDGELEDSKKIVSESLDDKSLPGAMSQVFETLERPLERPAQGESQDFSDAQPMPPITHPQQPSESGEGKDATTTSPLTHSDESEEADASAPTPDIEEQTASPAEEMTVAPETPIAEMSLPKPTARRSVITRTPPGPLLKNNMRANKTGVVAVDSKFSEFGAYQQRMVEAIARQWHLLASRSLSDIGGIYNTQVTVEFFLDHDGEITSYKTTFNTSSEIGKTLCEQAILSTAPYGRWTTEMRALFGDQNQSVKFNFYYR